MHHSMENTRPFRSLSLSRVWLPNLNSDDILFLVHHKGDKGGVELIEEMVATKAAKVMVARGNNVEGYDTNGNEYLHE